MTKKHYIHIAVCSLLIIICSLIFYGYYRDYIAPESYTIGTIVESPYKKLAIADYVSDEDVIFSQNINHQSFVVSDNSAEYECVFDATDFNGLLNEYSLYINDCIVGDFTQDAGTCSGYFLINFYDVHNELLSTSSILVDFSFYSLSSKLLVSVPTYGLEYLNQYFKTDNFVITLAKKSFDLNTFDLKERATIRLINLTDTDFSYRKNGSNDVVLPGDYQVQGGIDSDSSIILSIEDVAHFITIDTDGEYTKTIDNETNEYVITWTGATYINITINSDVTLVS